MKSTHTHKGNCQACGATQAVDNAKQTIAKHGYQVARFGRFVGTCPGSDRSPAQIDVSYTHRIMEICTAHAVEMTRIADLYASGDLMLTCYTSSEWSRKQRCTITRKLPLIGCTDEKIAREYKLAVHDYSSEADRNTSHVKFLTRDILPLLGTALPPVEDFAPKAKPADGKLNMTTGHVEGTFRTKAAKKAALESLNHDYEIARRAIQDTFLAIAFDDRTPAGHALYNDLPFQLNHYRPGKHGPAVLALYPQHIHTVAQMERLVSLREMVKATEVTK